MTETAAGSNTEKKCPQCGAPLLSEGMAGLCPACLLKQATTETATQPDPQKFQPPTIEELGRLFPQLEILSFLGKGGMGAVYKARQPMLDRIVALKILPAEVTRGTDFGERFSREARALAKLNHPNIVMVYEFGQVNGQPFFIMEYVDGLNLRQLEQQGKLSPREALQVVPQICEALQFAHDAGIVHRDIKPDNILLDKKGRVKIADFGIAKILGTVEDPVVPATQGSIGTPHYMAPEQVDKPQTVDHRADIFSLGVVFYEMLTGELPLGKFAPPSSGPRGLQVDVRLDEVVLRALERKPELRYQHASQVKTAVETIASTQSGGASGAPASVPNPESLLKRDYRLEIRNNLRRGWALVKSDFWPTVGITALILVLLQIAILTLNQLGTARRDAGLGFGIFQTLLTGPMLAGLSLYFLKKIRREPATVETAFAGFSKRFLHLFLANFVMSTLLVLGFALFILPGIYLMVSWVFTLPLVLDKGMDFWPAMELSRKMVHKHWWKMLLFLLTLCGLWILGGLFCGVGVFVAAPVSIAAFMYAYEDVFGPRTPVTPVGSRPTPPAPPAQGPGGTMVVPVAEDAPPKKGGPPTPPIAGATPASGGGENSGANKSPRSSRFPIITLLLVGGLIAVGILFANYRNHVRFEPWNSNNNSLPNGRMTMAAIPLPSNDETTSLPPATPEAVPTGPLDARMESTFVDRVRKELGDISIRFAKLDVASSTASKIVVTFTGLQQRSPGGPTNAASGVQINDINQVASVSATNELRPQDLTNPERVDVPLVGSQIATNKEAANTWQDIEGSLIGTWLNESQWLMTGTGRLSAVRFEMPNMDLQNLLVPPISSHDKLAHRLEAAETIRDDSNRDKSLANIAEDAAKTGELELVKHALEQMVEVDQRDETARQSSLRLAKAGFMKQAIEIAKVITDDSLRDNVLVELAK